MQINFEQFVDRVFRFALSLSGDRHVAEDLTQECFLRAYERIGQLQSEGAAKSWLFQILANLWKDQLKRKRVNVVDSDELEFSTGRHDDKMIQQEAFDGLVRLMQTLPGKQRSVLFLSAVEQMSHGEISELLGMTANAVKANLSVARKVMREKIMNQEKLQQQAKSQ